MKFSSHSSRKEQAKRKNWNAGHYQRCLKHGLVHWTLRGCLEEEWQKGRLHTSVQKQVQTHSQQWLQRCQRWWGPRWELCLAASYCKSATYIWKSFNEALALFASVPSYPWKKKKKINQQPHEVRQQGECKGSEFRIALRAKDSRAPSTHLYLKVSESWPSH